MVKSYNWSKVLRVVPVKLEHLRFYCFEPINVFSCAHLDPLPLRLETRFESVLRIPGDGERLRRLRLWISTEIRTRDLPVHSNPFRLLRLSKPAISFLFIAILQLFIQTDHLTASHWLHEWFILSHSLLQFRSSFRNFIENQTAVYPSFHALHWT